MRLKKEGLEPGEYEPRSTRRCHQCWPVELGGGLDTKPTANETEPVNGFKVVAIILLAAGCWLLMPDSGDSSTAEKAAVPMVVEKENLFLPCIGCKETPKVKVPKVSAGGSTAAAVWVDAILPGDAAAYLKAYSKIAQREMLKNKIPASITLAQGLLESSAGLSDVALECNNHFGLKCFAKKHKGCCVKFFDDGNEDSFRKFSNEKISFVEHTKVLKKPRYASCFKQGKNWRKWAVHLQKNGYATDSKYADKLIGAVLKHELWKFDGDGSMTPKMVGF